MPFSTSADELFVTERIAAITVCNVGEIKAKNPEHKHWLSNVVLSIMYNNFPPSAMRPFVINFVRRIYVAFIEYDLGRKALLELLKKRGWSPYYAALTHFEVAIAQLYVALDSIRKVAKHDFFRPGDGSFEECLNRIYNAGKHEIAINEIPVWLTNDGLECAKAKLTFEEIEDFMSTMVDVVTGLSNAEVAKEYFAK